MSRSSRTSATQSKRTWRRYWLFQIPGLVLVGALTWAVTGWLELPRWICWLAVGAWAAKDAVLYPMLRTAYSPGPPTGVETLVGCLGRAHETLDPSGLVKIGPELWRATSSEPVLAGQTVRVVDVSGMTLQVSAVDGEPAPD